MLDKENAIPTMDVSVGVVEEGTAITRTRSTEAAALLDAANELIDTMDDAFAEMTDIIIASAADDDDEEEDSVKTDSNSSTRCTNAFESMGTRDFMRALNGCEDAAPELAMETCNESCALERNSKQQALPEEQSNSMVLPLDNILHVSCGDDAGDDNDDAGDDDNVVGKNSWDDDFDWEDEFIEDDQQQQQQQQQQVNMQSMIINNTQECEYHQEVAGVVPTKSEIIPCLHGDLQQKEEPIIGLPQDRLMEKPIEEEQVQARVQGSSSTPSVVEQVVVGQGLPILKKNDHGEETELREEECTYSPTGTGINLPLVCQDTLEISNVTNTGQHVVHDTTPHSDGKEGNVVIMTEGNDLTFYQKEQIRSEKIAQSQAEDILNVTLALQQMEEAFKGKENEIEKIRQDLCDERAKTSTLTLQVERQNSEMDQAKDTFRNEMDALNLELSKSRTIAKAAEEDAQEALDLAKENDEKRKEMEILLSRALDEMDFLRNQEAKALPMITEENDDIKERKSNFPPSEREEDNSIPSYINQVDNPRLSAGRNLLRHALNSSCDNDDLSSTSSTQGSISSSSSYLLDLTRKAADKRRKLRSRLSVGENSSAVGENDVVCYSSSSHGRMDLAFVGALNKTCKSVTTLMTKSGKALNLGGRWFNSSSSASTLKSKGKKGNAAQSELEPMARNYCKSVEALIARQKEQVNELRSFCEYLEHKVAKQKDDTF